MIVNIEQIDEDQFKLILQQYKSILFNRKSYDEVEEEELEYLHKYKPMPKLEPRFMLSKKSKDLTKKETAEIKHTNLKLMSLLASIDDAGNEMKQDLETQKDYEQIYNKTTGISDATARFDRNTQQPSQDSQSGTSQNSVDDNNNSVSHHQQQDNQVVSPKNDFQDENSLQTGKTGGSEHSNSVPEEGSNDVISDTDNRKILQNGTPAQEGTDSNLDRESEQSQENTTPDDVSPESDGSSLAGLGYDTPRYVDPNQDEYSESDDIDDDPDDDTPIDDDLEGDFEDDDPDEELAADDLDDDPDDELEEESEEDDSEPEEESETEDDEPIDDDLEDDDIDIEDIDDDPDDEISDIDEQPTDIEPEPVEDYNESDDQYQEEVTPVKQESYEELKLSDLPKPKINPLPVGRNSDIPQVKIKDEPTDTDNKFQSINTATQGDSSKLRVPKPPVSTHKRSSEEQLKNDYINRPDIIPRDIRGFVKKYRGIKYNVAKNYVPSRELDRAVKQGEVLLKRNRLW